MKKIKFFLLIIIIIGIISIPLTSIGDVNSYNVVIASRKNEKNSFSKNNIKNEIIDKDNNTSNLIFDFKTLEKYDKHLIYKIKYPVINNKDINFKISDIITNLASNFKNEFYQYKNDDNEEKFIFILNTDIQILKDSILFVKFDIERNYSTYPNPVKFYETYIIDITSGEFLSIEDIFINGYEDLFYDYAKNYFFNNYGLNITKKSENYNYIKPNKEVYKKIFLKDENVEVFFYDYKKQEEIFIKIPFENVLPYIKKEYIEQTTTTTLASTTTTNKEITTQATTVNISENSTQTTVTKETTTEQITTDKVTTEQIIKENNNRKRKIDKNKPMIALTFDDGPNGNTTNKILDVLEENNSVATFFLVSRRIEKDKETLKRMDMLGNQIGNHTANHKDLTKLSKDKIKTEVDIVNKALKNTIGKEATIVRVPYGAVNDTVKQTVEYPIIMWNIDTKDWKNKNANTIQKEVLGKVKDGDIVLMHDLYDSTAKACEVIIPKLVEQGYQLVTVEELFEYKGIEMKKGNKYSNANKK